MQSYSNQLYAVICNGKIPLNVNEGCVPKFLRLLEKFKRSIKQMATQKHHYIKPHWVIRTSYLLCYHEVIAEGLTGTNGSQQKNKDHVQKPPANNKNKLLFFQQEKTIENSAH